MNPETLNSLLIQEPFVPLRLTLTTGETLDLPFPDGVFIGQHSVHIFGVKRAGEHIADWDRIISLRHIVKVEKIETAPV